MIAVAEATPESERAAILPILVEKIHYEPARAHYIGRALKLLKDSQISSASDTIESFAENGARAEVLATLVSRLVGPDQDEMLRSFLGVSDNLERYAFLRALPDVLPALVLLEGPVSLTEVRRAICDAGRFFP